MTAGASPAGIAERILRMLSSAYPLMMPHGARSTPPALPAPAGNPVVELPGQDLRRNRADNRAVEGLDQDLPRSGALQAQRRQLPQACAVAVAEGIFAREDVVPLPPTEPVRQNRPKASRQTPHHRRSDVVDGDGENQRVGDRAERPRVIVTESVRTPCVGSKRPETTRTIAVRITTAITVTAAGKGTSETADGGLTTSDAVTDGWAVPPRPAPPASRLRGAWLEAAPCGAVPRSP